MLEDLYHHMAWADAAIWRVLLSEKNAADDQALHKRLHHIHLVQHAFLRIWTHQQPDFPPATEFEDLPAVMKWGLAYHHELPSFLASVSDADLQETVAIPWSKRVSQRLGVEPDNTRLQETMMQVVFHSAHHRGQVAAHLRQLGGEPPLVDYIAWVWMSRPGPDWPAEK